jgi:hypothetical protein
VFEVLVSTLLLSAAFATVVPLLGSVAAQRRAAEQRQLALQEVANVMERYAERSWADIKPETDGTVELSSEVRRVLHHAALEVKVDEATGPPAAKRIAIELRWKDRSGRFAAPIRLVTWVYQRGSE